MYWNRKMLLVFFAITISLISLTSDVHAAGCTSCLRNVKDLTKVCYDVYKANEKTKKACLGVAEAQSKSLAHCLKDPEKTNCKVNYKVEGCKILEDALKKTGCKD